MKIGKQWTKAEELRLQVYRELGIPPQNQFRLGFVEKGPSVPVELSDFGMDREDGEFS